jgi:hypothetical protein
MPESYRNAVNEAACQVIDIARVRCFDESQRPSERDFRYPPLETADCSPNGCEGRGVFAK